MNLRDDVPAERDSRKKLEERPQPLEVLLEVLDGPTAA
jgi:hypothetical protein